MNNKPKKIKIPAQEYHDLVDRSLLLDKLIEQGIVLETDIAYAAGALDQELNDALNETYH